ncbi:ATP-grasp domain-containing protein [Kitasatospora sp. MAP5-34]|uniref:ATP-grasp domain-containing protein n=1 Tax=Kitasatospora sp. MAP5-34 TaxID=3035102 RepID=UPI00247607C1|nr:ATP-grasp domain-containing protein [Kitasatospora sp. MAP5-34]MDH6574586.1 biotin carboxylase [Kitasatospora sp. MAP5-34]
MGAHVLVVGDAKEIPGLMRSIGGAETRTSVICRLTVVSGLRDVAEHQRVVGVAPEAGTAEWVELALAVHRADPVTAVGTFGERDQDRAAAIAAALGLPMHHPDTVAAVHDKALMRRILADAGVDETPAALVSGLAEAYAFAERHGYPLIAKPGRGAGSTFVARIASPADLAAAVELAGTASEWSSGTVLMERLLQGPQISVEALSEDGEHVVVGVCGKVSEPEHLVEVGHLCPAPLDAATRAEIERFVPAVLDALGIEFGVTHTELVLTAEGPRVIETHIRPAGDEIPSLVRDATGVDLIECVVRQTIGERVLGTVRATLAEPRARGAAIWFASPDAEGVLREVAGVAEAGAAEGVVEVAAHLTPGALTSRVSSSRERGLYVRAVGDSAEQALQRARTAAESVTFLVETRHLVTETV